MSGTLGGSSLASWTPVYGLVAVLALATVALLVRGRGPVLGRIPDALQRLTGQPGWAVGTVALALFGLLQAGIGFYTDVAWHVALGRDETLFTAPHTNIAMGLSLIFAASIAAVVFATATRAGAGFALRRLRVPWSALPMAALGGVAVFGFPMDELWHAEFGVDVTMWSPTHMMMILGASFTGLACWLVLAEAGVPARGSRWGRGLHLFAAALTLQGLVASQGEFAFGVPQYNAVFHPLLLCVASGFAFTAARLVHGPWWALGVAVFNQLFQIPRDGAGGSGPVDTRHAGVYLASAVAVELAARLAGTDNRLRFALASGAGVGTIGLAGEWLWNQNAWQPWRSSLLPEAVVLGLAGAVGAAVVATGFVRAFDRVAGVAHGAGVARARPVAAPVLALAGLAVVATILLPLPRRAGDVRADVTLEDAPDGGAGKVVRAVLTPPDAADDAYWFQVSGWQGGGLVLADMEKVGDGEYVSEEPVPLDGHWKALLRLHRGDEMMAVPLYLPADPAIGEQEIPAVDRSARFETERRYLLRETHPGRQWFSTLVHGLLAGFALLWAAAFVVAVRGIQRSSDRSPTATSALTATEAQPISTNTARAEVASRSGPVTA